MSVGPESRELFQGLPGDEIDEIQPAQAGPRLQKCAITGCPGRLHSYGHTCNVCSRVVHTLCSHTFLKHITIKDPSDLVCSEHAEQQLPPSPLPQGPTQSPAASSTRGTSSRRGTRRGTRTHDKADASRREPADYMSPDQTQDSTQDRDSGNTTDELRKNYEGNLEKINELESQLGNLAEVRLVLPNDISRHLEAFLECVGFMETARTKLKDLKEKMEEDTT